MEDEEEEDVRGLLFENAIHDNFCATVGIGKGGGEGEDVDKVT